MRFQARPYRRLVSGLRSYFSYRWASSLACSSQNRPLVSLGQPGYEQGRLGLFGTIVLLSSRMSDFEEEDVPHLFQIRYLAVSHGEHLLWGMRKAPWDCSHEAVPYFLGNYNNITRLYWKTMNLTAQVARIVLLFERTSLHKMIDIFRH